LSFIFKLVREAGIRFRSVVVDPHTNTGHTNISAAVVVVVVMVMMVVMPIVSAMPLDDDDVVMMVVMFLGDLHSFGALGGWGLREQLVMGDQCFGGIRNRHK